MIELLPRARWLLGRLWLTGLMLWSLGWALKGRLVDHTEARHELRQLPLQGTTDREPFSFEYKGKACRVRPVASYELWGLVVSHNNIESFADIYHDSTSVDTKDLCVIWGANLESSDFQKVKYKSGSWTCYFSYPRGVRFTGTALGNNHLITDDPWIRDRIAEINVGDQVYMSGLLADYQMDDWRGFWRKTSTVRNDSGCEVVFVEQLEILERGTPGWYAAHRLGWIFVVSLPFFYLVVFWLEARNPSTSQVGRL